MLRSVLRPTSVIGLVTALLAPAMVVAATPSVGDLETELVPPLVHRVLNDGPDHPLSIGPEVDAFHDLLVTSDGSVIIASFHDGRVQNGAFDAWPMRVWTLGQPGASEILIPTANSGLAEGPDGRIYLAGEGRFLARWDGTDWEVLAKQQDVAPYRDHVIADDGTVWAAFGPKLYSFDGERWVRSRFDDSGQRVNSLERTADGRVWLHIGDSLLRHRGGRWTEMQPRKARGRIRTLAIDADPDGGLWTVIDNGVGTCDPASFPIDLVEWAPMVDRLRPRLTTSPADGDQKPRRCAFGRELLAGSDGSSWVVRERSIENLTDSMGSLSVGGPPIRHAEADGDGNIWILAPDRDRETSDLYVIQTGAGD